MEEFRKKITNKARINSILCSSSLMIYIILKFLTKNATDFGQGLAIGVWLGLEIVALVNTIRLFATLRNEKLLKELYIKENDERNKAIERETSQKSLTICTVGIAAAAIVSGFYDAKICTVLCAVLLFTALVTVSTRIFYNKTM